MAGKNSQVRDRWDAIAALPAPAVISADAWAKGGTTIQFANAAFCALTGYSAAELNGKNTRLLHGPRTDVVSLRQDPPAGYFGGAGGGEGWLQRKGGGEFYARWKFQALNGEAGGPLVVVYHDDTDYWRQREALIQAQKLGTIGQLTGGVAHDFNNLLSVINGYCEILGPKLAHRRDVFRELQEIHRSSLKASAITRQILEFSRRQQSETGVINFNTLIREITEIIRRVCDEGIEVELRLASDLGNARMNPIHFQQVLLNLCFNARDAMPKGGRLTLRTFNDKSDTGPRVALQVIDTGVGLDPVVGDKIFEPFYTTKPHGTGLGLPTAQDIIRQARGQITARNGPDRGTLFEVILPETAEPVDTGPTQLGVLPNTKGTESILVIERDPNLRKMVTGILSHDGYITMEASTVAKAAKAGALPQLVVTDDGSRRAVTFLRKLAKANRQLCVVCTSHGRPKITGVPAARITHLPKPFALSSLLSMIRALLDTGVNGNT